MTATIAESVADRPIYRAKFKHVPIQRDRIYHPVVPTIKTSPNVDLIDIAGSENLQLIVVRLPTFTTSSNIDQIGIASSESLQRAVVRWTAADPVTTDSSLTTRLPYSILPTDDWANLLSVAENEWNIEPVDAQGPEAIVREFASGVNGIRPLANAVDVATRLVNAAVMYTVGPHITVDDEDGDLDIHLRLTDGLLVMANLFSDGAIDASVYDDSQGIPVKTVKRMPRSKKYAEELISLFEKGRCAGTE